MTRRKKKKSDKRLRLVALALALVAVLAFWFAPAPPGGPLAPTPPPMTWRVPVKIPPALEVPAMPPMPQLPPLPQLPSLPSWFVPPEALPSWLVWPGQAPGLPPQKPLPEERPRGEGLQTPSEGIHISEALPKNGAKTAPRIALVIDDMGLQKQLSARAMRLPKEVALSFLPYASGLAAQIEAARGHPLMLHLPMEPVGREDPGPGALFTHLSPEEVTRRTLSALETSPSYVGVNNHMGSRFTTDEKGMRVVLQILKERGLFFLDSRTSPHAAGEALARDLGVPTAARDVFIDDQPSLSSINAELARLEILARRHGATIAIGHPRLGTLEALEGWIPELARHGFVLVPLTELLIQPTAAPPSPAEGPESP